jgi:peptide/nickel transport system substrate-binding protein
MPRKAGYVTRQAERLSAGQINRRRFVASALSAGVTLPTALSLASKAEARVPKQGGFARAAFADRNGFNGALAFARGNALTEITASGDVIGELAETIGHSSDHRRWTFTLRKDVAFHDGQPLTSEDVLATLSRQRPVNVEEIRATGRLSLSVRLARPDPDFPRRLAGPRFVILPAGEEPGSANGTGPYVLNRFQPGVVAELTRNPTYWKPNRAHFDAVRLTALPEAISRQSALMTGEVDYADRIDPCGVALLRRIPTLSVVETPGSRHLALTMDSRKPPFDNADLRQALRHGISGQSLVERLLFGHGSIGEDHFRPEDARALYRRSGHAGTVPLAADAASRDATRLIVETAKLSGIEIKVVDPTGNDGWRAEIRDDDIPDAHVPLRFHDIMAHSKALARESHPDTDASRLVERWWMV